VLQQRGGGRGADGHMASPCAVSVRTQAAAPAPPPDAAATPDAWLAQGVLTPQRRLRLCGGIRTAVLGNGLLRACSMGGSAGPCVLSAWCGPLRSPAARPDCLQRWLAEPWLSTERAAVPGFQADTPQLRELRSARQSPAAGCARVALRCGAMHHAEPPRARRVAARARNTRPSLPGAGAACEFGCSVAEGRVEAGSPLGQLAAAYGFAPFTVAVAGSYFARLAARDADLLDKASARPRPRPPQPCHLHACRQGLHMRACHGLGEAVFERDASAIPLLGARARTAPPPERPLVRSGRMAPQAWRRRARARAGAALRGVLVAGDAGGAAAARGAAAAGRAGLGRALLRLPRQRGRVADSDLPVVRAARRQGDPVMLLMPPCPVPTASKRHHHPPRPRPRCYSPLRTVPGRLLRRLGPRVARAPPLTLRRAGEPQNIDRVAFCGLPAAMLGHCAGAAVLPREAAALEVEILQALSWRLGPFLANE